MDDFIFQKLKEHMCSSVYSKIQKNKNLIKSCENKDLKDFYETENKLYVYYKLIFYNYDSLNKKEKNEFPSNLEECFLETLTKSEIYGSVFNENIYLKKIKDLSDEYKFFKDLIKDQKVTEKLKNNFSNSLKTSFKEYLPSILLKTYDRKIFI
jgi:hypothetical protein